MCGLTAVTIVLLPWDYPTHIIIHVFFSTTTTSLCGGSPAKASGNYTSAGHLPQFSACRCVGPPKSMARKLQAPCNGKRKRLAVSDQWQHNTLYNYYGQSHDVGLHAPSSPRSYCVDLLCGIGGWSCGAQLSGHTIALAVDNNTDALAIHRRNHPRAKHVLLELGDQTEETLRSHILSVIPENASWHLHMSPPCQTVSAMQSMQKQGVKKSIDIGMNLVNWCMKLVFELEPTSWSFEQVSHPELHGLLRFLKYVRPDDIDYARVDFAEYGLSQHRIRILAGSPCIMRRFLNSPHLKAAPSTVARLLPTIPNNAVWQRASVGKTPDPSATVRNSDGSYSNATIRRDVRSIHSISWTCTARHPHAFLTVDYQHIREQTPRETATLQSFPESYTLASSSSGKVCKCKAQTALGNAFPPLVARKLMDCF